ncbi:MAG: hypothetical protein R3174_02820 [Gammaproteobacteria bacterium]|nr:hypothetical protein [Gammaproteobacteria bacterium]
MAQSPPPKKPKDAAAAEVSLNEALNDLERILESQKDAGDAADKTTETPAGEQYNIPLLNDVIVPGAERSDSHEPYVPPTAPPGSPEYEEACRLLVTRIANEIEVIVQSRVEAALSSATEEIRQQVQNHIEIMLPEILDEILRSEGRHSE